MDWAGSAALGFIFFFNIILGSLNHQSGCLERGCRDGYIGIHRVQGLIAGFRMTQNPVEKNLEHELEAGLI